MTTLEYQEQQDALRERLRETPHTSVQLSKLFDNFKRLGDACFKAVQYEGAVHNYTMALLVRPDTVTYANRSLSHFKLENYAAALADGKLSVELDASYTKGFYRIGVCEFALQNYAQAVDAFSKVLQLSPNETGARHQLLASRKAHRDQQYARAVSGDDDSSCANYGKFEGTAVQRKEPSPFDRINFNNREISPTWRGPIINFDINYIAEGLYDNGNKVVQVNDPSQKRNLFSKKYTKEFVECTVEWFKADRAKEYPRIFVYHILQDFSMLMRTLPTVVDYHIPTLDDIDCTEEEAKEYERSVQNETTKTDLKIPKENGNNNNNDDDDDEKKNEQNQEENATPKSGAMGDQDTPMIAQETENNASMDEKSPNKDEKDESTPTPSPQPDKKTPTVYKAGKLNVCGDTHGQFWDLLNIFRLQGDPSPTNPFLFNGDYVDRGSFGYELVLTLMLYKLHCPLALHMTRGNHETINMNRSFGFYGEVIHKADLSTFDCFTHVFNALPLAYVLGNQVLILHGGLFSNEQAMLTDLRKIDRYRQPPESGGLMVDCLWSDPTFLKGRRPSVRGAGCQFGADVTKAWLDKNGLNLIVRSHEMKHAGYEVTHEGKLVTIFSAPNYCLAEGSMVSLTDGTAKPIEKMSQFNTTEVLSFDPNTGNTTNQFTNEHNRVNQGVKMCVEIVLEDGKVVKCTPDHRFIVKTDDDRFEEITADALIPYQHNIMQTVQGVDIQVDNCLDMIDVDNDSFFIQTQDNVFSWKDVNQQYDLIIIYRIIGYLINFIDNGKIQICSELDFNNFQNNFEHIFKQFEHIKQNQNSFIIQFSQTQIEQIKDIFEQILAQIDITPLHLQREFISGYCSSNIINVDIVNHLIQDEFKAFSDFSFNNLKLNPNLFAKLFSKFNISLQIEQDLITITEPTKYYQLIGLRYNTKSLSQLAIISSWNSIPKIETPSQKFASFLAQNSKIPLFFSSQNNAQNTSSFITWTLPMIQRRNVEEPCETFDLCVENSHLFAANGVVVHNCDSMGNKGAVMMFDHEYKFTFKQFEAVPHPPVRAMFYADPYLR
jgi:diadenosine tetraphosphatase ApaH/serine/threonine PP2A family protein phosphatase/tetratricopeptide (TPR) repeat protein